jgi:glucose-fructose oxidoreductase
MKRRSFLGHAFAGIGSVALTSPLLASMRLQKKEKLGVALVGLGYYSTDLLAPALQLTRYCSLAGIVTGTPAKAKQWQQQYHIPDKNIYDYKDFDSIVNNDAIDIVYVVLPPSMHAEYAVRAAQAGKHVWCEKPMAMTVQECQHMISACNKNKVKLSIGYRMQHEPNTQQIIAYRKKLTYGPVRSVIASAGYFDPRTDHWKQKKSMGGGSMYDMGVYPLNAARYSTGLEPIAVTAHQSTTRPEIYKEVDETMSFDLEFAGGVTAKCESSFGKGMNKLEVKCAKGWYTLEPFQAYSGINGTTSDGIALNASIPNEQAKQMDEDALAILNGTSVLVPGEEGLKDIRVVEAIYRSVAQNKRVTIS